MGGLRGTPLWALLLANAVPLVGALFLGWQLAPILVLYWAESAVIGVVTVLRILASPLPAGGPQLGPKLFLVPFFCVHFGTFMLVHGIFLTIALSSLSDAFPSGSSGAPHLHGPGEFLGRFVEYFRREVGLVWTLVGLLISHLWSFAVHDVLGGERLQRHPQQQMFRPYPRIIVMHMTLIVGLGIAFWVGDSWALAAVFVVVKTIADVAAHRRDHREAVGASVLSAQPPAR